MASALITAAICPALLFAFTLFQGHFLPIGLALGGLVAFVAISAHTTLNPSTTHPLVNGCLAFMSIFWVMRCIELTLIRDLTKLKRIQRLPFSPFHPAPAYTWQQRPKRLGYERICWTLDLVANPRAVGWSHGPADCRPPSERFLGQKERFPKLDVPVRSKMAGHNWDPSRESRSFCWLQLRRFLCACTIVNIYQDFYPSGHPRQMSGPLRIVLHDLDQIARFICLYAMMDGGHALISFITVRILGVGYLHAAGESWAYPPLFGPFRFSIGALWGSFWHGLFRETQLSIATWLVPTTVKHTVLRGLMVTWLSFMMTGIAHFACTYAISRDPWAAGKVFLCFCIQPLGLLIPHIFGPIFREPRLSWLVGNARVNELVNIVYTYAWFHWTIPPLLDDPALVALLADVPNPVSLIKLLRRSLLEPSRLVG